MIQSHTEPLRRRRVTPLRISSDPRSDLFRSCRAPRCPPPACPGQDLPTRRNARSFATAGSERVKALSLGQRARRRGTRTLAKYAGLVEEEAGHREDAENGRRDLRRVGSRGAVMTEVHWMRASGIRYGCRACGTGPPAAPPGSRSGEFPACSRRGSPTTPACLGCPLPTHGQSPRRRA